MIVATAFCPNDEAICLKQAQWIRELGGAKGHSLLLVFDARCNPEKIQREFEKSFDEVKTARCVDNLQKWAESANLSFATAARHVEFFWPKAKYWLFLEPDCIPITHHSLDLLEADHQQGRKPFTGARVEVDGVPLHMSGNAVWPTPLHKFAGEALLAHDIAFDVFAAVRIVPQAHWTDLIAHSWDRDYQTGKGLHSFPNWKSVEDQVTGPHPRAVFYHGDKSGTLIDRLREHLKGGEHHAEDETEKGPERKKDQDKGKPLGLTESAVEVAKAAPLLADIFIKTYPKDYPWLKYCLRSIDKFCTGFRRVVIVSPETKSKEFLDAITGFKINVLPICNPNEMADGYLFQQSVKLHADEYSDAEWFLHLDSDTIFTVRVTPQTYLSDGKFVWMMTPYGRSETPWQPITEKFIVAPVQYEFMRRFPFLLPRWIYKAIRNWCIDKHQMTMQTYISVQPEREFSEFNALGAFAWLFHQDKFSWVDTSQVAEKDWPALTVDQQWSHNPIPTGKWDKILSEGHQEHLTAHLDSVERALNGLIPWEDRSVSQLAISQLSEELKRYCTAPRHTKYVRDQLKKAGVIR